MKFNELIKNRLKDLNLSDYHWLLQYIFSVFLCFTGLILLGAGFIVNPLGIIDQSVLVAVGEIFTFSGSILGITTIHKQKNETLQNN